LLVVWRHVLISQVFELHNVFDLYTNPGLYDHDFGQSARFWISVRGAAP
jgi:hypothetical protein